jgi:hypothetical protein
MFSFLYHCQDFYQTWLYIWVTRRLSYQKQELLTLRKHPILPPDFWWGNMLFLLLVVCVVLFCVFTFWVLCCDVRYDFRKQNNIRFVFASSCYLCLYAYSGVQHILCCIFVLFVFVLCTLCYQFLWIVFVLFVFVLCTLCYQFLWIDLFLLAPMFI